MSLEEAKQNAKLIRAFLQGLAYANNCKRDTEAHQENAWHYSDLARQVVVEIESHKGRCKSK